MKPGTKRDLFWLVVWASIFTICALLNGCGDSASVTRAQMGPCTETATVPLSIQMPGCAATQGIFMVPKEFDGMTARAAEIPGCSIMMRDFPAAALRLRGIRFAMFCQANRPIEEAATDVVILTGTPGNGSIKAMPELVIDFDLNDCAKVYSETEVVCREGL